MNSSTRSRNRTKVLWVSAVVAVALALAGCAGMPFDPSTIPFLEQFLPPTPTFTPTPSPTPSPTPEPTKPGETPTATPVPTPQVTIPDGFTPVKDDERGYSLAVPRGWTALDLRSSQFQNMANTFGMGAQLGPLNDFLASEQGKSFGVVYITDLTAAMFGGLPTVLNVSVIDAPGATQEWAMQLIDSNLKANAAMLGDVNVRDLGPATINNLPAIRGSATANLASVGMNTSLFAKVVGLIANDKIYVMTLATTEQNMGKYEPVFDQIIGTFRPE